MGFWGRRIAFGVTAAVSAWLAAGDARAANGAFAVDAADISDVGSCKVESWISTATNSDFSAVANPSCVANIFKPVELSVLTNRSRSDGDWSTSIAPKAKWNLVPTGIGKFGFSFYAGGSFDALTGENLTAFAVVPATYRLSETMRINVNAGWLWDRMADRHYLRPRRTGACQKNIGDLVSFAGTAHKCPVRSRAGLPSGAPKLRLCKPASSKGLSREFR